MGVDLEALARQAGARSMQIQAVPPRLSDEAEQQLIEINRQKVEHDNQQAAQTNEYQRVLNERQFAFTKAQLAYNYLISPVANELYKAENAAKPEDLELQRLARRAALRVLISYLDSSE